MFEMDLYEDYICPKCNRSSELCNCQDEDNEVTEQAVNH